MREETGEMWESGGGEEGEWSSGFVEAVAPGVGSEDVGVEEGSIGVDGGTKT